MATASTYRYPRRGCQYEEDKILVELFALGRVINVHDPRFSHLVDDDGKETLDGDPDDVAGPLLVEIPRKYLIEVRPDDYPPPTEAQLAVPAATPTLDDRIRRDAGVG